MPQCGNSEHPERPSPVTTAINSKICTKSGRHAYDHRVVAWLHTGWWLR
jgi:hypothetical protein